MRSSGELRGALLVLAALALIGLVFGGLTEITEDYVNTTGYTNVTELFIGDTGTILDTSGGLTLVDDLTFGDAADINFSGVGTNIHRINFNESDHVALRIFDLTNLASGFRQVSIYNGSAPNEKMLEFDGNDAQLDFFGKSYPVNIGAAGTDFDASGGLTLADSLNVSGTTQLSGNTTIGSYSAKNHIDFACQTTGDEFCSYALSEGDTNGAGFEILFNATGNDLYLQGTQSTSNTTFIFINRDSPKIYLFGDDGDNDYITKDANDDILIYKDGSCAFNATGAGACS